MIQLKANIDFKKDINIKVADLPIYPNFKQITLKDLEVIREYKKAYLPYSEFSCVSIYAWDFDNSYSYSFLNNNLVLKIRDEFNDKFILTFLGQSQITNTIQELLKSDIPLRLIPASNLVYEDINYLNEFCEIKEDENNFDYVYSCENTDMMVGSKYEDKRSRTSRFSKRYGNKVDVKEIDLCDQSIQNSIKDLSERWLISKGIETSDSRNDLSNLIKICNRANLFDLISYGVFDNEKLVGYFIFERIDKNWVIGHFVKADLDYKFLNDFLFHECMKDLYLKGLKYMNFEQDLGIMGLRQSKKNWRPINFLKKYTLSKR